jgi:hypothetical protein
MSRDFAKAAAALAIVLGFGISPDPMRAEEIPQGLAASPASLTPQQFAEYQTLIKPAAYESPWAKISWHASVWEARKQAAAEGKPILIWSGGGSPPLGAC